jgi:hypothetical protein
MYQVGGYLSLGGKPGNGQRAEADRRPAKAIWGEPGNGQGTEADQRVAKAIWGRPWNGLGAEADRRPAEAKPPPQQPVNPPVDPNPSPGYRPPSLHTRASFVRPPSQAQRKPPPENQGRIEVLAAGIGVLISSLIVVLLRYL